MDLKSPTKIFWDQTKKFIISKFKTRKYKCHQDLKSVEVKLDGYCPELDKTLKPVKGEIEKFIDTKELIHIENKAMIENGYYKSLDKNMEIVKREIFKIVEKNGASVKIILNKGFHHHEEAGLVFAGWQYSTPLTKAFFYLHENFKWNKLLMAKLLKFFKIVMNQPISLDGPIKEFEHMADNDECHEYFRIDIGNGEVEITS